MTRITLKHLNGACEDQKAIFKKVFPTGAPITLTVAKKAIAHGLEISWLTKYIPIDNGEIYDVTAAPARKIYNEAVDAAWKIFNVAIASALVEALEKEGK